MTPEDNFDDLTQAWETLTAADPSRLEAAITAGSIPEAARQLLLGQRGRIAHTTADVQVSTSPEGGNERLNTQIDAFLRKHAEMEGIPGRFSLDQHLREAGLENEKEALSKAVLKRLEALLDEGGSFKRIVRLVFLLHDFPAELGGGQHTGMHDIPEIRKKLVDRLLAELKRSEVSVNYRIRSFSFRIADRHFDYLLHRLDLNKVMGINPFQLAREKGLEAPNHKQILETFIEHMIQIRQ